MKISEMTNDQATEALIRIASPFEAICEDDEFLEALDKLAGMKGQPVIKVIGQMLPTFINIGLKKHRADLYEIVGALTMKPIAQVGKMNFKETVVALQESYDSVLMDFFTHTAVARKINGKR